MRRALLLTGLLLAGGAGGALLAAPGGPLGAGGAEAAALERARTPEHAGTLARPFDAPGLTLPPLLREATPERRAFERNCLICHGLPMILGQRLTAEQWKATIAKMRDKYRAPLEPLGDEERMIADLLSRALGKDEPPVAPSLATSTASPVSSPTFEQVTAPLPGADAARGAARFEKACAACHGKDARGGANGPRLVGRPPLADPEAFEALLRDGRRGMPALPGVTREEARDLLEHLRALTRE